MRMKKTPRNQRNTYKYTIDYKDGSGGHYKRFIELMPGIDGVTEEWITLLHKMDDHEVYINCKNMHPTLTDDEKKRMAEWEEVHGEVYKDYWNLSLDYFWESSSSDDKNSLFKEVSYDFEENVSEEVIRLREVVNTMTDKQKMVYQLHFIEGYSLTEISHFTGCSIPNIKKHYDKAILHIKKNFNFLDRG